MAGHHAFADLRTRITDDPVRAERLAAAERQVAEEQAAYDQVRGTLERARAYTHAQLALTGDDVARIEQHATLYLSTLQNYLEALGSDLNVLAHADAHPIHLTLADLLPTRNGAIESAVPIEHTATMT